MKVTVIFKKFVLFISLTTTICFQAYSSHSYDFKDEGFFSGTIFPTQKFSVMKHLSKYLVHKSFKTDKSLEELDGMFKTISTDCDQDKQLKGFNKIAKYGCVNAMISMGKILSDKKHYNDALEWYVLAFQKQYLEKGIYDNGAIEALKTMVESKEVDITTRHRAQMFLDVYKKKYRPEYFNQKLLTKVSYNGLTAFAAWEEERYYSICDEVFQIQTRLKHMLFLNILVAKNDKGAPSSNWPSTVIKEALDALEKPRLTYVKNNLKL